MSAGSSQQSFDFGLVCRVERIEHTQAIGLLAQEIDNPFFSVVIKGVDQAVSTADYDLLLCTTHSRREKEADES